MDTHVSLLITISGGTPTSSGSYEVSFSATDSADPP